MLEVLFRLFVAGGLMMGSAQLSHLVAGQPTMQGPSHGLERGHSPVPRGLAATTAPVA